VLLVEDRDSEVLFGKPDEKRTDLPAWSTPWAVRTVFAASGVVQADDRAEHDVHVIVTEQRLADLRELAPHRRAKQISYNCAHTSTGLRPRPGRLARTAHPRTCSTRRSAGTSGTSIPERCCT
jgi:hypothetical protein